MGRFGSFTSGFGLFLAMIPIALIFRGIWAWVPIAITFGFVPVLDRMGGISAWNPRPEREGLLAADRRYRTLVALWVPVGVGLTIWGLFVTAAPGLTLADRIGLILSIGFMNGVIGITYAHELIHQPARNEQLLGDLLLALVCYGHWHVEHVFGHHRNVATPADPSSARRGESFFRFYFRSVRGSLTSAIALERARLVRAKRAPLGVHNRLIWLTLTSIAFAAIAFLTQGSLGLVFFLGQSVVAFSSLEIINYIEHYGLRRRELEPGRYENVRPEHSWNASQRVSNALLINLARHSDHHAMASRRYQILRTYDEQSVPQLPSGYAAMFLVALVPPLWFRLMDPRVDDWNTRERDLTTARTGVHVIA